MTEESSIMSTKRVGYYVHGRYYFGLDKRSQALAKKRWLEAEFGTEVEIEKVDYTEEETA